MLAGRHVTRRCDGDSLEGSAFGVPIFYGYQAGKYFTEAPSHPGNAYWYQAKRANEVFQMLDGKQRKIALIGKPRKEEGAKTVRLTGKTRELPGIPIDGLSDDQKEHVRKVFADVLAPCRKKDAEEALKLITPAQFDHLHIAFYRHNDLGQSRRLGRLANRSAVHVDPFSRRTPHPRIHPYSKASRRLKDGVCVVKPQQRESEEMKKRADRIFRRILGGETKMEK